MQDTSVSQSLRCLGVWELRAWMFSGAQWHFQPFNFTIKGRKKVPSLIRSPLHLEMLWSHSTQTLTGTSLLFKRTRMCKPFPAVTAQGFRGIMSTAANSLPASKCRLLLNQYSPVTHVSLTGGNAGRLDSQQKPASCKIRRRAVYSGCHFLWMFFCR